MTRRNNKNSKDDEKQKSKKSQRNFIRTYGTNKLMRTIQQMFKRVIRRDVIPKEKNEMQLTSIFKKGKRKECKN